MRRLIFMFCLMIFLVSCNWNREIRLEQTNTQRPEHMVVLNEFIQGSQYTYMRVSEDDEELWLAISKQQLKKGETYYFQDALQMTDFYSKELDRTFDLIYFVSELKTDSEEGNIVPIPRAHKGSIKTEAKAEIKIEKEADDISIAMLYQNPNEYAGKIVKIKGVVVKLNKAVLDRNWIHIQDGTKDEAGNYDLTITSQDLAEVDEKVMFEGIISINKNFGSGYFYKLIMENAKKIPLDKAN